MKINYKLDIDLQLKHYLTSKLNVYDRCKIPFQKSS